MSGPAATKPGAGYENHFGNTPMNVGTSHGPARSRCRGGRRFRFSLARAKLYRPCRGRRVALPNGMGVRHRRADTGAGDDQPIESFRAGDDRWPPCVERGITGQRDARMNDADLRKRIAYPPHPHRRSGAASITGGARAVVLSDLASGRCRHDARLLHRRQHLTGIGDGAVPARRMGRAADRRPAGLDRCVGRKHRRYRLYPALRRKRAVGCEPSLHLRRTGGRGIYARSRHLGAVGID